jgi:predicted small secreted protein
MKRLVAVLLLSCLGLAGCIVVPAGAGCCYHHYGYWR